MLNDMQNKILLFIKQSISKQGYPPSIREIGKAVGLSSTSSVDYHLAILKQRGYIQNEQGKPRTITVLT